MLNSILSLVLQLTSVFLCFKNGWGTLQVDQNPESVVRMSELGISASYLPAMGVFIISVGVLLLFPQTFFIGNVLNAICFVIIMALALNAGNYKMALIEIPFLAIPLILIFLKYPFKN